ncbi:sugar-binding protein [Treponema sp.]
MKKIASLIVPLILLSFLLIGSLIIVAIAGAPARGKQIRIITVLKTIDSNMDFWEVVKSGMRVATTELNLQMDVYGPWAESDVPGQLIIMDQAIKEKPAGIILSATDFNALVPLVEKAKKEGIPIVTLDSGVNSSIPISFVATNNVEAGEKAGRAMMALLEPGKKLAIINHVRGATTAIQREDGVTRAIKKDGRYPIVGTWFTNNYEENAYALTKQILVDFPDLAGILAMNEVSTVGSARALKDLGLAGKIRLVGFDSSILEIKLIEEGVIDATVIQKPFNMGYISVKTILDAIEGRRPKRFIDTESVLITAQTLYLPENQKLLFPFVED